jgi:hypothetical protein
MPNPPDARYLDALGRRRRLSGCGMARLRDIEKDPEEF